MAKSQAATKERKKAVRLSSLADQTVAANVSSKLMTYAKAMSGRPAFREARSLLMQTIIKLEDIDSTAGGKAEGPDHHP